MPKVQSQDPLIDGLLWLADDFTYNVLSWHGSNELGTGVTITYNFLYSVPSDLRGDVADFERMNANQRDAVTSILAMYESFTDITFIKTSDFVDADIGFGTAGFGGDGTAGITWGQWYPFQDYAEFSGNDVFLGNDLRDSTYDNPEPGSFAYHVLVHEIGHALGLDHPFEHPFLPYEYDSLRHTVMSYTDGFEGDIEPQTIMPLDVAALQYLYGANENHNRLDDTYDMASFDDGSIQTIWDAGGTDTVDLANLTSQGPQQSSGDREHLVDLREVIDTGAKVFLSGGMQLENVVGSDFQDRIYGNQTANIIDAGAGNDFVVSGAGADTVNGDAGNDTLINPDGASVLNGGSGGDVLLALNSETVLSGDGGWDRLIGGRGDDTLSGDDGNDILIGDFSTFYFGDDTLTGGNGDDRLMGGEGADTFVFDANDGDDVIATVSLPENIISGVDFTPGLDIILLEGFGYSDGATALSHVADVGGHATFDDPNAATTIVFYGLTTNELSTDDFQFL